MTTPIQPAPVSKARLWTARILSGIPAVFMLTSGINLCVTKSPSVLESFVKFGYPEWLLMPIGILEFVVTLIYVIPRTSVLGAVLLTGYLGGATATHVRVSDPTFLVPIATGILIWTGLFMREERLWALLPLRKQ